MDTADANETPRDAIEGQTSDGATSAVGPSNRDMARYGADARTNIGDDARLHGARGDEEEGPAASLGATEAQVADRDTATARGYSDMEPGAGSFYGPSDDQDVGRAEPRDPTGTTLGLDDRDALDALDDDPETADDVSEDARDDLTPHYGTEPTPGLGGPRQPDERAEPDEETRAERARHATRQPLDRDDETSVHHARNLSSNPERNSGGISMPDNETPGGPGYGAAGSSGDVGGGQFGEYGSEGLIGSGPIQGTHGRAENPQAASARKADRSHEPSARATAGTNAGRPISSPDEGTRPGETTSDAREAANRARADFEAGGAVSVGGNSGTSSGSAGHDAGGHLRTLGEGGAVPGEDVREYGMRGEEQAKGAPQQESSQRQP